MAEAPPSVRIAVVIRALAAAALVAQFGMANAQAPRPWIYFCTAQGKAVTSDRPITTCDGEQRVLNPDGSSDRVAPPPGSDAERAEQEERDRQEAAEDTARAQEARRDRNLLTRYPTEARYNEVRGEALDSLRRSIREAEVRTAQLSADRKNLLNETEYYNPKALPPKLKVAMDSSDAALAAQKLMLQDRQADLLRVTKNYDDDLVRLKKLWPAR
jgi:hypothetical protein